MSEQVKKQAAYVASIFTATEEALQNDWDRKNNLQFPTLLDMISVRLVGPGKSLEPKVAVEVDSYMRSFVRNHPEYYVSRGAGGGIMLASVHEAKLAEKAKVTAAKAAIKAKIDTAITNNGSGVNQA